MCICLWPDFDCPEVTLCGWQDIKIQLLLLSIWYLVLFSSSSNLNLKHSTSVGLKRKRKKLTVCYCRQFTHPYFSNTEIDVGELLAQSSFWLGQYRPAELLLDCTSFRYSAWSENILLKKKTHAKVGSGVLCVVFTQGTEDVSAWLFSFVSQVLTASVPSMLDWLTVWFVTKASTLLLALK